MTDEYVYKYVISKVRHSPYRMLDESERMSIIDVAYTEAFMSYRKGAEHFVDYALRYIYASLDEAKYLYYRKCRLESPVEYEDACAQMPYTVPFEESIDIKSFLWSLPPIHRQVALGYINSVPQEDICTALHLTVNDMNAINHDLRICWLQSHQTTEY